MPISYVAFNLICKSLQRKARFIIGLLIMFYAWKYYIFQSIVSTHFGKTSDFSNDWWSSILDASTWRSLKFWQNLFYFGGFFLHGLYVLVDFGDFFFNTTGCIFGKFFYVLFHGLRYFFAAWQINTLLLAWFFQFFNFLISLLNTVKYYKQSHKNSK